MEEKIDPYAKAVGAPVERKSAIKRSRTTKVGLPGSFWIPRESVETLLMCRATAVQIGVYLVIAKQTDRAGRISTTGVKVLRNRLGIGDKQIHAALAYLEKIQVSEFNMAPRNNHLLYTAGAWNYIVDDDTENIDPDCPGFASLKKTSEQKSKRKANSWVINNVGTKRYNGIWFNSALVGTNGNDERPLADIIRQHNADSVMRLLLMLHHHYDIDMGAVDPFHVRYDYQRVGDAQIIGNYVLQRFKYVCRCADQNFIKNIHSCILGCDDELDNTKVSTFISDALSTLDRMGLLIRLVAVWSKPKVGGDSVPLYLLDQKSDFRQLPRDKDTMMADQIEKVAKIYDMGSSSGNNGFYDTYTVITQLGVNPTVVQMYKPTYIVEYRNNERVRQAVLEREHNASTVKRHLHEVSAKK